MPPPLRWPTGSRGAIRPRAPSSPQSRRRAVRAAASAAPSTSAAELAAELRANGARPNLMAASPELGARVEALLAEQGAVAPSAARALELGDGEWEVFYMPHIKAIAGPLGLQVTPRSEYYLMLPF